MPKVLLTTNHPAPYINRWIETLSHDFDLETLYYSEKAKIKAWKNFEPLQGHTIKSESIASLIQTIKTSDIIILGGWNAPWYGLIILLSMLFRKKRVLFSDYPENTTKNFSYYFKRLILFHCLNGIFCATQSTINFYSSHYTIPNDKLMLFPYLSTTKKNPNDYNWNQRLKEITLGEPIRILIANNFYPRKGYKDVLQVLKRLKSENLLKSFTIRIAGVGEEFEEYKTLFEKLNANITFLRWIEDAQYQKEMSETDIFLHASVFEPFGIPPIDAMKFGKILITTTGVKSIEGIIENGINGFIYNPSDIEALTSILKTIVQNKKILPRISEQAQQSIQSFYDESIINRSIERILDL